MVHPVICPESPGLYSNRPWPAWNRRRGVCGEGGM